MLRVRRIYDDTLPANREAIRQVKEILRESFEGAGPEHIEKIDEKLRNPFKQTFKTILLVAEDLRSRVLGFALLMHDPEIGFCFLDWIAVAGEKTGGGLGGLLYEHVREECIALHAGGLFLECLPDETVECDMEETLDQNRARLAFYERYGARPVTGTEYELPIKPGDRCMPHLLYDGLDTSRPLRRSYARKVVRAILERKYADQCPPEYVERVVRSLRDDPVQLRQLRYIKPESVRCAVQVSSLHQVALVVNEHHDIHHVHDRGYVEAPVRVQSILSAIEPSGIFSRCRLRHYSEKYITAVHDPSLYNFIKKTAEMTSEGQSVYPYVFPIRNKTRPPKDRSVLAGYYCIDTFTPVNRNAYRAARGGVDSALTAASEIIAGRRLAYALVRPPGHHAERQAFGGFCYFNNNAVAAQFLSRYGRVAILDLDYHHGNGQQDIFYRRADVLTISIHGHPRFAYPYFTGFEDERGEAEGEGFNMNIPLPESVEGPRYLQALQKALLRIEDFRPQFLVLALGLDTARGDPTGTWGLRVKDFENNGKMIGQLGLPTLVVQEGGYKNRTLGRNAMSFFKGLAESSINPRGIGLSSKRDMGGIAWRYEVRPDDPARIRRLVEVTGFFNQEEIHVAEELPLERLSKGEASGYFFVIAEHYGRMVGYTCYGPISGSAEAFDLYWIAVHPDFQRRGLGRLLIRETEGLIRKAGGGRIYVDTSERAQYASTRMFYESCGYRLEALLKDFYAPGDGKCIFCKILK